MKEEKQAKSSFSLPENAYRELGPNESYVPVIRPGVAMREVTVRSVVIGVVMAVFFSAAVAYLTLKIGQGLEAAIPIAILSIGISLFFRRRSTLLENVNILAIGATSGIVVGGSLFTMPAIYILGLDRMSSFFQIFFVPLLGAVLGVLLLIPLRRYFVAKMHGKLPFPEGTATTEVLITGEKGGKDARILAYAMVIGGAYDFCVLGLRLWRENFTTEMIGFLEPFTQKVKAVFALNTTAAIAGLGYLIGVRYASYILAGSFFSYFVVVPMFGFLGDFIARTPVGVTTVLISRMSPVEIFTEYARYIGIGGIFMAGIVSILKMLPVIVQAFGAGFREIARLARAGKGGAAAVETDRTDRDIPMWKVLAMILGLLLCIFLYFRFVVLSSQASPTTLSAMAVAVAFLIAFLFTAVSAWAVAMISVTPISGMTLLTLIISALLLSWAGLSGKEGMLGTLLIGGVVCTALSMAGTLVTEFKISYWLGASPWRVQWSNILGCIVSAVVVTAVMILLGQVHGFVKTPATPGPLPAPQANAMADVIKTIMATPDATKWYLYGFGAAVAVIIEMTGVSSLAFALGMYIPIEYNSPIIVGAIVAHLVRKSGKRSDELGKARYERGILLSSGFIAGGALMGVLSSLLQLVLPEGGCLIPGLDNSETSFGNWFGLVTFLVLCGYLYWDSLRVTPPPGGGSEARDV
jgi:putative OPT family oligopeptide transporter